MAPSTFLGIDGGGTTTTARLEDERGAVVFERSTAASNLRTIDLDVAWDRFDELLDDSCAPQAVAVCLPGMHGCDTRARVREFFERRFPTATIRLEPDYAAAFHSFDEAPTACVVAGTGSLVCSRDRNGALVTSGGMGYLLGDEGSAFRLGQLVVRRCVEDPASVGSFAPDVCRALGVTRVDEIITAVYAAPEPAGMLARASPVLSRAAIAGHRWACTLLADEMDKLAGVLVDHLAVHDGGTNAVVIGLAGGVWSSTPAREAFTHALQNRRPRVATTIVRSSRPPVCGAVQLAREATR